MKKNITELAQYREELELASAEQKALADTVQTEGRSLNDEELAKFDELEAKKDELARSIATLERLEKVKAPAQFSKPAVRISRQPSRQTADKAFRAFLTKGKECFKDEYAEAAQELGFKFNNDSINLKLYGASDLLAFSSDGQEVGNNARGGYTVNDTVISGFERALKSYWDWSNFVTVRRTAGGAPIAILTNDDTANEGAYTDELAAVTAVDTTFNRVVLNAYKITSGIFPVSNELLEDSSEDISAIVGYNLGQRIARKLSREFTVGDGLTGHVRGFTLDTTSGGNTNFVDAVIWEDLVDLFYSVSDVYRASPSCGWMMHSSILASLVKTVDDVNRPLYQGNYQEGPRLSLLGKPVFVNDFLPSTFEAGDNIVYFGDWSKYVARISRDVTFRTSSEKYFLEDAVATIATCRVDGKLVDAGQHPIKHLVVNPDSGAPSIEG